VLLTSLSNQLNNCLSKKGKEENNVPLSLTEVIGTAEEGFKSLETYVGSAMAKYVLATLTQVSARLTEQHLQIQTLLDNATANASEMLDKTAQFEEDHLRRLKEIEDIVGAQGADRQRTTMSMHADLEKVQAQIAKTMAELMN